MDRQERLEGCLRCDWVYVSENCQQAVRTTGKRFSRHNSTYVLPALSAPMNEKMNAKSIARIVTPTFC
jgi:hypothetical protein